MDPDQRTARIVGVAFILTFIFSIPTLWIYSPILDHPSYILGAGHDTRIALGALSEVLLAISGIVTAVALYPVAKRQSERLALGYVAVRIVESTLIVVGLISLMAIVTLRQDLEGTRAAASSVVVTSRSLLAIHDGTFLLGPSFCAGIGNGIILGTLMYRSGLVPRRMAMIGLVGGPLAFLAATLALLGAYDQNSGAQFLLTVPEIIWEAAFGLYLTIKGFRPSSPILNRTVDITDPAAIPAQASPV